MPQMHRITRNNTSVRRTDDTVDVRLYSTTVVFVDRNNGTITLDSGGWRTATTKNRMNQASNELGLGFSVSQSNGIWTVNTGGKVLPFADGMTFPVGA